jgi:hypothetical protein
MNSTVAHVPHHFETHMLPSTGRGFAVLLELSKVTRRHNDQSMADNANRVFVSVYCHLHFLAVQPTKTPL